jgi:N-acetyl-1-D-myo-inositol-2-amino-2-deoxy-alpha-D-glucopyranoside deacetylase
MNPSLKTFWKTWRQVALVCLLLAVEIFLPSILIQPEPAVSVDSLTPLSLSGYHSLLVFAPHCDDETLGAGGLILAAEQAGIKVHVVIGTNGDGFLFATLRDFKKIYPTPRDYIRLGEIRQQESLAALKILGVGAAQVDFLGYPDRGTPALWNDYWGSGRLYRSPYSEDTKSPYPLTYDKKSVYTGEDYLADVTSILKDNQPDLVVYPHADDVHPDHWGMNAFVRLAVNLLEHSDPSFKPAQFTYLVHRPDFPDIKGLNPQTALTPPSALFSLYPQWYRLNLTAAQTAVKGEAVKQYRSQLTLLRSLMDSFVRANELFAPVQDANLPALVQGTPLDPSTWLDKNKKPVQAVQLDPTSDFITRSALPASDLVSLYAAHDQNGDLSLCAQVRENAQPELLYSLRWKAIIDNQVSAYLARTVGSRGGALLARRSGKYICASMSLAKMGSPRALFVSASVAGGGRLMDEIGWQMVDVGNVK